MAAKGVLPADLAQGDAGAGKKPLPVHVGQRDHGDGQREMAGNEPGQAIQLVDGLAVKQAEDAESFQSTLFIQRQRGGNHTALLLVALPVSGRGIAPPYCGSTGLLFFLCLRTRM